MLWWGDDLGSTTNWRGEGVRALVPTEDVDGEEAGLEEYRRVGEDGDRRAYRSVFDVLICERGVSRSLSSLIFPPRPGSDLFQIDMTVLLRVPRSTSFLPPTTRGFSPMAKAGESPDEGDQSFLT